MPLSAALAKIARGEDLSAAESQAAFDQIFEGAVPADQLKSFLIGLREKGETADEVLGAVRSMRGKASTLAVPVDTIDIVGTGGDVHGTFNISTAVALVTAACGVKVAKHGNRAVSSRAGSSDICTALGINLEAGTATQSRCMQEANLCFLFAPRHHPAMRNVAAVRKELGTRTIFNLLGPLTNPANVKRHLIGVYDLEWLGPMAEVLKLLGSETAWLVHGHDGMDEITTTGPTDIVEMKAGMIRHFTLEPEHAGLPRSQLDALKGGDAAQNAEALQKLLCGARSPYRDIVLFNTAAALIIAGKAADLPQGVKIAGTAIDNGGAQKTLDALVRITNAKAA